MRKILIPIAIVAALLGAAPAFAHGEIPVVGVVKSISATTIEISMKDGETVKLAMDVNTRVMKDGERLGIGDLKIGQSVSAVGFGDSLEDLIALDVTISRAGKGN